MSKKGKYSKTSKRYNELLAFTKKLINEKSNQLNESEQLFEDDPRALKEKEYGRVRKKPTHVFSKSTLSDI
jgi:hypothetical protein|tara:strand:- start:772 stop:984 length:213 start_codon:yes stop_codon:yes gene_type:complete